MDMRTHKNSKKVNNRVLYILLALVLAGGIVLALMKTHVLESSASKQKQQTAKSNAAQKAATVEGNGNPPSVDANGKVSASPSTYTPPANSDNIVITPRQDGNQVVITTKLVGYSDGNCDLTITNGSKNFVQSAQVIYAPNYSTCAGFSVPTSSLGGGNWTINLAVTSGGKTTTQTATFEVH